MELIPFLLWHFYSSFFSQDLANFDGYTGVINFNDITEQTLIDGER